MELFLVRHAKPEYSDNSNEFPGPGLCNEGVLQAKKIARFLEDKNIQSVWASDFARVVETLEYFKRKCDSTTMFQFSQSLRERNPKVESHESLVLRVEDWFKMNVIGSHQTRIAIFSHCGPLNMVLDTLDPSKSMLTYPFEDEWKCRTPIAGIWKISIINSIVETGKLIQL